MGSRSNDRLSRECRVRQEDTVCRLAEAGRSAVVLDDAVHKVESGVHYAPVYMAMFLEHETLPEKMPYEIGNPIRFPSEDVAK